MKMRTLTDLYTHLLRDMYYAENQLVKALPKMIKAAADSSLKKALKAHLLETKIQTEHLEEIFKLMTIAIRGERCPAMEGLLTETQDMIDKAVSPAAIDVAITAAGRKIEHYEIGSYRTLIEMAKILGHAEHVAILKNILAEEKSADKHLSHIAEKTIYPLLNTHL